MSQMRKNSHNFDQIFVDILLLYVGFWKKSICKNPVQTLSQDKVAYTYIIRNSFFTMPICKPKIHEDSFRDKPG